MHISRFRAAGVLSYAELDLPVEPGLTVVTGPNGSGKTNLGRLVSLAVLALRGRSLSDWVPLNEEYAAAGHFGATEFAVHIGVVLDDPASIELLDVWARAALIVSLTGASADTAEGFDHVLPDSLDAAGVFGRGDIVVRHDPARRHPWRLWWEGKAAGRDFVFDLDRNVMCLAGHDPAVPYPDLLDWLRQRGDPLAATALADTTSQLRLAELLDAGQVQLVARCLGIDPEPSAIRALYSSVGKPLDTTGTSVTFADVLYRIVGGGLAVVSPGDHNDWNAVSLDADADPAVSRTGTYTAERLLHRKMGDAAQRAAFADAQQLFRRLTHHELEVTQQEVQTASGGRAQYALPVVPIVAPDGRTVDIPLRLAGRGIGEAAGLAFHLTEPTAAAILDEPATALSAVAQRRLLRELRAAATKKQTVLITHSAHLVPVGGPEDLGRIVRLTRGLTGATVVHRLPDDPATFDQHRRLLADSDIRDVLFSAAAWLVEGPTEQEALTMWLSRADEYGLPTPESAYVPIVPVGGHEGFAQYAALMHTLGVPYGVLADGPAFRPGGALRAMPEKPDIADVAGDFGSQRRAWATVRVRTVADDYHDDGSHAGEVEALFHRVDASLWESLRHRSKIRRGAAFAAQTDPPTEILQAWNAFLGDVGLAGTFPASGM